MLQSCCSNQEHLQKVFPYPKCNNFAKFISVIQTGTIFIIVVCAVYDVLFIIVFIEIY